jgi:hypothetical protein
VFAFIEVKPLLKAQLEAYRRKRRAAKPTSTKPPGRVVRSTSPHASPAGDESPQHI